MIHLGRLSLLGTGIVFGGVTLGAALAAFANPLPRQAEPAPWELGSKITVGDVQPYAYSMPQDLVPVALPDSYAPPAAFTELRWPVEPRMATYAEPAANLAEAAPPAPSADDYAQLADRPIAAPHYAAIEQAAALAAAPAEVAASEAPAAEAAPAPEPAGGVRIIQVANAS